MCVEGSKASCCWSGVVLALRKEMTHLVLILWFFRHDQSKMC